MARLGRAQPFGAKFKAPPVRAALSYTLTADSGSYTLTGQAAILKAARLIAAGQGSYTLSGQAAILKAARLIAAAQGSYTLNGRDASLIYSGSGNKTISAGQGSYALTGQAATLKATRKLAAAQGSYSLNGQSAALSYSGAVASYTLTAGQGSFTLTGFDALFTVIVPVFETTPRFSNTRRVGAARNGDPHAFAFQADTHADRPRLRRVHEPPHHGRPHVVGHPTRFGHRNHHVVERPHHIPSVNRATQRRPFAVIATVPLAGR